MTTARTGRQLTNYPTTMDGKEPNDDDRRTEYDHGFVPLEDHDEPSAWIFVHTEQTYPGVTMVEGVDPTKPTSAVTLDEDEFRAAIGTYGRVKTEQDDNE